MKFLNTTMWSLILSVSLFSVPANQNKVNIIHSEPSPTGLVTDDLVHSRFPCFEPNALSLCFRARLSAKPLIWNWFFILLEKKIHFHEKGVALGLVLKVSFWNSEVDWWHQWVAFQVNRLATRGILTSANCYVAFSTCQIFQQLRSVWTPRPIHPLTPSWATSLRFSTIVVISTSEIHPTIVALKCWKASLFKNCAHGKTENDFKAGLLLSAIHRPQRIETGHTDL